MAEESSELEKQNEMYMVEESALQTRPDALIIDAGENGGEEKETSGDTDEIREKIEATRREMGETIDAIQEKLSVSHIAEQVKEEVSEQIGGAVESVKKAAMSKAADALRFVDKSVKDLQQLDIKKMAAEYPLALSLVGFSIGALLISKFAGGGKRKRLSKKAKRAGKYAVNNYDDDELRYLNSSNDERQSSLAAARDKIGDAASTVYESVGNAATGIYESVGGAATDVYESVGGAVGKTYQSVGDAAGYTYQKAGDLGGKTMKNYNHYIKNNPLAVGAVALAVGAAVGFAIPLTEKENEYMGEMRDNVLEKAQATAQDAIGTVKQVASEAQKTIVEEVKANINGK